MSRLQKFFDAATAEQASPIESHKQSLSKYSLPSTLENKLMDSQPRICERRNKNRKILISRRPLAFIWELVHVTDLCVYVGYELPKFELLFQDCPIDFHWIYLLDRHLIVRF